MEMDIFKKMSNVTATVAYMVFLVRKLYTEQIFVLVSSEHEYFENELVEL